MNRRILRRLLAALLSLLLLAGCSEVGPQPIFSQLFDHTVTAPEPTEALVGTAPHASVPEKTEATEAPIPFDPQEEAMLRWQNAGKRDYLPDETAALVPFSQMTYERPDLDAIYTGFDLLIQLAAEGDNAETLLQSYYDIYSRYVSFYSMDSLAYVLYSLDITDPYYQDEYNYCESESPTVEEKLEALYKAFAASPARDALEVQYFGEGFFAYYDDYEVYTNPEYLRLTQEEHALLTEYRALTAELPVTYRGETKPLEEWLEAEDMSVYLGVLQTYYLTYNPTVGDLYVRLIRVRQQLAEALGYDSYADYSYAVTYGRDYSPEEGRRFMQGVKEYLVPVLTLAEGDYALWLLDYGAADEADLRRMLRSAAEQIGGSVWDAYRFMNAYELCDIGRSAKKLDASYQTYFTDYEAPFVFLNAQGTGSDYFSFAHEFGHFTDSFCNYDAEEDLETAETFSQAMEFLALTYTDTLAAGRREVLCKLKLKDLLETFVYQSAYADFEDRVYALPPEELTVGKVNETYQQVCREYGIYEEGFDFYYTQSWIDIYHFFEAPCYVISYCVSAETALQVYRLEAEEAGAGVAAYFRLLNREAAAGVQQVMADASLESPFREGVLEQTAAFFLKELDLTTP